MCDLKMKIKMEINEIEKYLKENLSEKRFVHSLNVAKQAEILGEIYGEDKDALFLAGLVHDSCKEMSEEKQRQLLKKANIKITPELETQKKVWHGFCASVFIKETFGIDDERIIDAVKYHTTGKENMSLFTKIIYIADITSEERAYPEVSKMRILAKEDLDEAVFYSLEFTLKKLISLRGVLNEDTVRAYNEFALKSLS